MYENKKICIENPVKLQYSDMNMMKNNISFDNLTVMAFYDSKVP